MATLETALERFSDALRQPKTEWTRDTAIQRFEFSIELAWKAVAHAARLQGTECASPRRAWNVAFELGWIDDQAVWLDMLEDRNRASHTHRETTAEQIFARLGSYRTAMHGLLQRLREDPSLGAVE
ncbi:MAG: nucleotidyltransferase substrate binding protein [Deltaproteobacteria bacterium]|nr:nucleotidyltransferase substrate binding protein [Deltaproteobacteria bacterium]